MDVAFRRAIADARGQGNLYFASLLPEDRIRQALGSASWFETPGCIPPPPHCRNYKGSCRNYKGSGFIVWFFEGGRGGGGCFRGGGRWWFGLSNARCRRDSRG